MKTINLVITHGLREVLKSYPKFEMDLGKRYLNKEGKLPTVDIQDSVVDGFFRENRGLIYKVGRIGNINLYTYSDLPEGKVLIYSKGNTKEISYIKAEVVEDIEAFLFSLYQES